MNNLLKVKDLNVSKTGALILENIQFEVSKGEYIGLVGPNGAGKTTLLHTLIGLEPTSTGTVESKTKKIGYVPQHFAVESFHLPLTVMELVRTGLNNPRMAASLEQCHQALKQVDILHFENKNIQELSGGERQKVLLARALADDPELLLLDEPMSALDDPSRNQFYELLKSLNQKGMTIILVSHDLEMVVKHVSRVLCMNRKLNYSCHPVDLSTEMIKEVFGSDHLIHHHPHDHA